MPQLNRRLSATNIERKKLFVNIFRLFLSQLTPDRVDIGMYNNCTNEAVMVPEISFLV